MILCTDILIFPCWLMLMLFILREVYGRHLLDDRHAVTYLVMWYSHTPRHYLMLRSERFVSSSVAMLTFLGTG